MSNEVIYFYDTNVLLENPEGLATPFFISDQTLQELEEIKTDKNKTEDIRSAARKAIKWLSNHHGEYNVIISGSWTFDLATEYYLDYSSPDVIIACAALFAGMKDNYRVKFVTHDLSCRNIAEKILGLDVEWFENRNDEISYTGFKEIQMDESEMAYFYEHQNENMYNLLVNEYIIIKDEENKVIDSYRWDGEGYLPTKIGNIKSDMFGLVKPYKGDIYQQCLLNSFVNNKITMVRGKAGTGKTYCALGYLCYLLDKRKIDKIILFTNTQPTINTARLGFYPGSRDEKLRESSVGNILASKLGDSFMVEKLMAEGKLILLPMCDIRGYDTTGMAAGILITEAQNLNIELMKLALQRIGEDSICIIDGDYYAQVDSELYSGKSNGMRRLSEVFRGQDFYGEIELQNIYRSKIADLAEKM